MDVALPVHRRRPIPMTFRTARSSVSRADSGSRFFRNPAYRRSFLRAQLPHQCAVPSYENFRGADRGTQAAHLRSSPSGRVSAGREQIMKQPATELLQNNMLQNQRPQSLAPPSSDRTCPSPHVGFFGQHTRSRFGRDTGQSLSAVLGLGSPHLYYF